MFLQSIPLHLRKKKEKKKLACAIACCLFAATSIQVIPGKKTDISTLLLLLLLHCRCAVALCAPYQPNVFINLKCSLLLRSTLVDCTYKPPRHSVRHKRLLICVTAIRYEMPFLYMCICLEGYSHSVYPSFYDSTVFFFYSMVLCVISSSFGF